VLTVAGLASGIRALNAGRALNASRAASVVDTSLPELGAGNPAPKLLGDGSSRAQTGKLAAASEFQTTTRSGQKALNEVNEKGQQVAKGATQTGKYTSSESNPVQAGPRRLHGALPQVKPTIPEGFNMERVSNLYGAMNEATVAINIGKHEIAANRVSSIMSTLKDFGGKQNYLNYLRSVKKGDEATKAEALLKNLEQFQAK
jgi:hypothetical protein